MRELLFDFAPWAFSVVAICLFVLLAVLAYQNKTGAAFVALLGAVLSGSFSYLDHLSEIAATATSLTIKVREASDALVGLRRLAALTGTALINLDLQSGSIGGDTATHRDQLKQQVLETLRSIGVDQATIKQVESESQSRDVGDFVGSIRDHVAYCLLPQARQAEWQNDFMNTLKNGSPNADAIQKLLNKYDAHDDFTGKTLDEYRYFMNTGQHRDTQFWINRDSWPTFASPVSEGGKQPCHSAR